jgi:hypothetical protein
MAHDYELSASGALAQFETCCDLLSSAPQGRVHPSYASLDGDCIRLIKILPRTFDSRINCQIQAFPLHDIPSYTAISYTWGSQYGICEILVDEHPLLVPKNLWRFLIHAKGLAGDLVDWIWIDMLSINQSDLVERGRQVHLMTEIFKTADRVVVWLGPAYRGSDTAMKAISGLSYDCNFAKQCSSILLSDTGHSMDALCRRPYWRRLWVFQELRLAQNIRLMCGRRTVYWSCFDAFMQFADTASQIPHLEDSTEVLRNSPAMRMARLNVKSVDTSLWNLVLETKHLRCADIRDKVYALIGVTTKGHAELVADYSMPVPTFLNSLLREIWRVSPPKTLDEAAGWCYRVERVMGVKKNTVFSMQAQRGTFDAPSNATMRAHRLGPKSDKIKITLWWTSFYGHSGVQDLLRESWDHSYFRRGANAPRSSRQTTTAALSLFQDLLRDMDPETSFLPCSPKKSRISYSQMLFGLEPGDTSLTWIASHLTTAIYSTDIHATRLLLEICLSYGLISQSSIPADQPVTPVTSLLHDLINSLASGLPEADQEIYSLLETLFTLLTDQLFTKRGVIQMKARRGY